MTGSAPVDDWAQRMRDALQLAADRQHAVHALLVADTDEERAAARERLTELLQA